jgi:uncharacterized cupredoxin-like copper-binding protein
MRIIPILTAALLLAALPAAAHTERHFSAGEPGNAKKPARIVKVSMEEDGQRMFFEPSRIVVRKGEQIRFVMYNAGTEDHEFVLATVKENLKHAAAMKKNPHMAHHDPNAMTLSPFDSGELLWKFSKAGTFEFGCLIPGHREAGMHGTVVVE